MAQKFRGCGFRRLPAAAAGLFKRPPLWPHSEAVVGSLPPYSSPPAVWLTTSEAIRPSLSPSLLYLTFNQLTSSIAVLTVYKGVCVCVGGDHHYLPPDALLSPRMQHSGRSRGQRSRELLYLFFFIEKMQFSAAQFCLFSHLI